LLIALLGMFTAQQLLAPLIGPLSAQLELTASQLGLVFTITSVAVTLSSPLWGWGLDRFGPRPVLIAGAGLVLAGFAGFAVASALVLDETLTPELTFALALVFRSLLLGAGLSVLPVAALFVAGRSHETLRTSVAGLVGAAQGLAVVIGPVIGGVLAVGSLTVPLYVAPGMALLLLTWVLVAVKPETADHSQPVARTVPPELVRTFGFGFLTFASLVLVSLTATLLAFDRVGRTSGTVVAVAAVTTLGIGIVATQSLLVLILRWPADRLMRVGAPIVVVGCGFLAAPGPAWLTVVAFLVLAVGLGLAGTGFFAAATLGAPARRQGLVAGAACGTSGLAGLVVPMLSNVLYPVSPITPVIAAGVLAALATGLSLMPMRDVAPQSVA
jgi:MFS family permease